MPRLLDYLSPVYAWLAAIDPSLPRAIFVGLVFASVLLWRKLSPGSWTKFSSLLPIKDADANWFKALLLKTWQALPAAALGAVYGALGTGGDVAKTVKLALLGLLAPVVHEVAWRYQGNLGKPKPPSGSNDQPVAPTHIVFPQDDNGRPLELRVYEYVALHLRRRGLTMYAGAGLLAFALGSLISLTSCSPAAMPPNQPCSSVSFATVMAGCEARIRLECREGDQSCLTYQECKLAVKNFRQCKTVTQ